jgi:hypothetical protein
MQSRATRLRILLLVAAISVGSTCATLPETRDIEVHDHRLAPGVRARYEILPGMDTRRRGSALDLATGKAPIQGARPDGKKVEAVAFTVNVAGEVVRSVGRDDVDVPAGRNVQMGIEIPGPATVDARVENYQGHVSIRPGGRFFDIVSIEGIVGVGFDDTELRLRVPGIDLRDEKADAAFVTGGRLSLRPIPLLDLYGEGLIMAGHFASTGFEAGGQLNLTPNVGVYGGYRWWSYHKSSFQGSGSDLEARFLGPVVGAAFTF